MRDFVNDGREVENYLILPSGDLKKVDTPSA